MARYNVEHKGKWACFSSICDNFITRFMNRGDYEQWRKKEYGRNRLLLEHSNGMTMRDALDAIMTRKIYEAVCQLEEDTGLEYEDILSHICQLGEYFEQFG